MPGQLTDSITPLTSDTAALNAADSISLSDSLLQADTLTSMALTVTPAAPEPPAWMSGMEGTHRSWRVADNSGLLAMITLLIVLVAMSFRYCRRVLAGYAQEMFTVRRRQNVFDEHTSGESQAVILLVIQFVVYTGITLYGAVHGRSMLPPGPTLTLTLSMIALTAVYYLFQLTAYSVVAYTFTTAELRRQWLRGFNATQSYAGLFMGIPALALTFYPSASAAALTLGAIIYFTARILFIYKGFRIFYTDYTSCLYFILYLCTLEIIPLVAVFSAAKYINANLFNII